MSDVSTAPDPTSETANPTPETAGTYVATLRRTLGLSQKRLGTQMTTLGNSSLSRIEHNKQGLGLAPIHELAELCAVQLGYDRVAGTLVRLAAQTNEPPDPAVLSLYETAAMAARLSAVDYNAVVGASLRRLQEVAA